MTTKPETEAAFQQAQAAYAEICAAEGAIYPRKDPALTAKANAAHEARRVAFLACLQEMRG